MLVVSRKQNESITIGPVDGLDPKLTLGEVFARGPIRVRIVHCGSRTRLAIDAPAVLKIMRVSASKGPPGLESLEAGACALNDSEHAI